MTFGRPVALITGAAGGLGGGMCRALMADGWTVLAHVRREEQGRELADAGANIVTADLESRVGVEDLIGQVQSATGRLDALVNNAALGYGPPDAVREETTDGFESRLAVNVLAPLTMLHGLGHLLSRGGQVVNLASTNQELVDEDDLQLTAEWTRECSYRQSKALVLVLSEVYARRWAVRGIVVNAIHPGTRLPTKIVLESGTEPLGSLELGIDACVDQLLTPEPRTGRFIRAGEEPLDLDTLYPDRSRNDDLVERLEGLVV